jgi:hypothetical protein
MAPLSRKAPVASEDAPGVKMRLFRILLKMEGTELQQNDCGSMQRVIAKVAAFA